MSKYYTVLGILFFLITVPCRSESLNTKDIVFRFYDLLLQQDSPTHQDEELFFGESDSKDIKALLKNKQKASSNTAIWDYLREHRDLFVTKNLHRYSRFSPLVSDSFKMYSKTRNPNQTKSHENILVRFPEKRVTEHGYAGKMTIIIFQRGSDGYINIGATEIGETKTLFEFLYEEK